MRRYRLIISKVVYPIVSFICIVTGLKFYQSIDKEIRWLLGKKEGLLTISTSVAFDSYNFIHIIFLIYCHIIYFIFNTTKDEQYNVSF